MEIMPRVSVHNLVEHTNNCATCQQCVTHNVIDNRAIVSTTIFSPKLNQPRSGFLIVTMEIKEIKEINFEEVKKFSRFNSKGVQRPKVEILLVLFFPKKYFKENTFDTLKFCTTFESNTIIRNQTFGMLSRQT